MNSLGDVAYNFIGDGFVTNPSEAFAYEPNTGIYRDTSGSSTAFTISKRGVKRFYIDDTKTEVIGTFVADGIAPSGTINIEDGSASSPSVQFQTAPTTGIYKDGTGIGFSVGGTKRLKIDTSQVEVDVPLNTMQINSGTYSITSLGNVVGSGFFGNTSTFDGSHILLGNSGLIAGTGFAPIKSGTNSGMAFDVGGAIQSTFYGTGGLGYTITPPLTTTSISNSGTVTSDRFVSSNSDVTGTILDFKLTNSTGLTPYNYGTISAMGISGAGTLAATISTTECLLPGNLVVSGSISSGAITSSGNISNGLGTINSGVYNVATGVVLASGSVIANHLASNILTEGGALTSTSITNSGTLSSGAITSSGNLALGTNTITSGAITSSGTISCTTLSQSTLYSLRLLLTASAPLLVLNTATFVSWDTIETTGGGNSNFTISVPTSVITIPVAGFYEVNPNGVWLASNNGIRELWCEINSVTAGSTRFYGYNGASAPGSTLDSFTQLCTFQYRFAAGDTVQLVVRAGGTTLTNRLIGATAAPNTPTCISITRISN